MNDNSETFDDDIRFIKMIAENKILYDRDTGKGIGCEKRLNMVNKLWSKIAETFNMPDAEHALKRYRYYRDKFVREYRIRNSTVDGRLPPNFQSWVLYDHFRFLEAHVRSRRPRKSREPETSNHNQVEFIDATINNTSTYFGDEDDDDDDNSNGVKQQQSNTNSNSNFDYHPLYNNNANNNVKAKPKFKIELREMSPNIDDNNDYSTEYNRQIKRPKLSLIASNNDHQTNDPISNDDPEHTFAVYVSSEMRRMSKKRRNQLKKMIFNFITKEDEESD